MTRRQATIVLLSILCVLYVHLLVRSYNTKGMIPVSYPKGFALVRPGERLICDRVSDSIYIQFDNKYTNPIEAEYLINLEDIYKTIIYSVDDDTLYVCKPNEIQQIIDFNEQ